MNVSACFRGNLEQKSTKRTKGHGFSVFSVSFCEIPGRFLTAASACVLSCRVKCGGEMVLPQEDRCGHKRSATEREAVAAGVRYFGDQSVCAQQLEFATDARALSVACGRVDQATQSNSESHIAIAKAVDEMFAAQDRSEKNYLALAQGVQGPKPFLVTGDWFAKLIQQPVGCRRIIDHRQCFQVAQVGSSPHLRIAISVGHALGHRKPSGHYFSVTRALAANPKFVGLIDHCLDPQYAPMLVVHFYPV